jgi:hypothetical protein
MSELITVEQKNQQVALAAQPMRLIELAITQGADVEKLEKLMALQERWNEQQAKKSFFESLSQMQAEMPVIRKLKQAAFNTKNGGQMSYSYASLEDITEQIKPMLLKFGFSYRFEQAFNNGLIVITCVITHKDGHSEECSMPGTPDMSGNKNALQQAASAVTYLRRYTLTGALGIATADTDIDGRMAFNEGMNAPKDEITLESEAFLQDYYNGAPDEVKPQIMAWLKVQSFSQLTEAQAKKAITAIKAKK